MTRCVPPHPRAHTQIRLANIVPDLQQPPSIPDYITDIAVAWATPPKKDLQRCLYKTLASIIISPTMKHAMRSIARQPDAIAFVTACIKTSILGNYYHAAFNTASSACITIADRIAATSQSRIDDLFDAFIEPALAEYIAAKLPATPHIPMHTLTVPWSTFVAYAIALANHKIRNHGPMPIHPLDSPQAIPAQVQQIPADIQITAPTGHRSAVICLTCHRASVHLRPSPKAYKPLRITISPFKSHFHKSITCTECNSQCVRVNLHGSMLCLTPSLAIVVCPGCNHAHGITGPLKTTLCYACIRNPTLWSPQLAQTCLSIAPDQPHPEFAFIPQKMSALSKKLAPKCIAFQHPITHSRVLHQRIFDPKTLTLFTVPVCEAHISHYAIVTSDYTPQAHQ